MPSYKASYYLDFTIATHFLAGSTKHQLKSPVYTQDGHRIIYEFDKYDHIQHIQQLHWKFYPERID